MSFHQNKYFNLSRSNLQIDVSYRDSKLGRLMLWPKFIRSMHILLKRI